VTNRREFLQAAALSGLPVIAGSAVTVTAHAGPANIQSRLELHAMLVDARHAEARSAGTRLAGTGATVLDIPEGDITQLWLREIGPVWKQRPVAIAGLTARPALFCLEQFALTGGMRVVFHGEHIVYPNGQTEHSLLRGAAVARLSARELKRAGSLWPLRIADAVAGYRPQTGGVRAGRSEAALEPALPPGAQLLTSWIIAAA
jgi:hypothetical protein